MDLTSASDALDFFVIASGESSLQLKAFEEGIKERLKAEGVTPKAIEGPSSRWTLMDYGHIVVHLMSPESREFYDIEGLWADAKRLEIIPT